MADLADETPSADVCQLFWPIYLKTCITIVTHNSDKMSPLKYFKPIGKKEKNFALQDPGGALSEQVPSSSI